MTRTIRLGAIAGALLLAIVPALPLQADVPGDPDQIFRAARRAWSFTNYARYATYTTVAKFRNGTTKVQRHYDTLEDTRRALVFARTFSHEEIADPSIPHGIDIRVGSINNQGGVKANAEHNDDRIGPLALAVSYDFGISLLPQKTTVVSSSRDIEFPPSLPVIGTTTTATQQYTVRLIDMLDAGKTYHIGLTPARDPGRLRLREMWIAAGTYITQRILIAGNFSGDPYTNVPWLVEFVQVGGASYIRRETAEAPLDFDDVSLPNVVISFEDLQLLGALPRYGALGANDSSKAVSEP